MISCLNRTFVSIWVIFLTLFLVGCTCLPFSSPSSKTPVIGALSYSNIITYIEIDTYGNPEWDGWNGIGDSHSTLSYSISPVSENVKINESTGEITVLANEIFSNNFTVTATGHGDFQGSISTTLRIEVIVPFLVNVANVNDGDDTPNIYGVNPIDIVQVEGATYLFAGGQYKDPGGGMSIFSIGDDGLPVYVNDLTSPDTIISYHSAKIENVNYLFLMGNTLEMFSVSNDGSLVNVTNVKDDDNLEVDTAIPATTVKMGETNYLFVGGYLDHGISAFSVDENGNLSNIANISDTNDMNLLGSHSMTTAQVGGVTYLFVAGYFDDGLSVFSVGDDGSLNNVYNVNDDGNTGVLEIDGVRAVTTAVVGETTYLFTAAEKDNGLSVFSVGDDGSLSNVDNISDDDTLNLGGARSVTTILIEKTTYLFVAGYFDNGVSMFSVGQGGTLNSIYNISDNDTLNLKGAWNVITSAVGETDYLFVSGAQDDGFSVFSINP